MSEAKTLNDVWIEMGCPTDEEMDAAGETEPVIVSNQKLFAKHGDALVNPGFIVTAGRVEAAGRALFADERWGDWNGLLVGAKAYNIRKARLAITAAGGIVPDEVVALNGPLLWVKQNGDVVEMGDGDTLYIKRAGTSKDGSGIDRGE